MTDDTITVAVDQDFKIPLKSIGTAGYIWKIESVPDGIRALGSEIQNPPVATKPGDATTQVFRFRALEAGEHIITFALARPWENKAIETRSLVVKAG